MNSLRLPLPRLFRPVAIVFCGLIGSAAYAQQTPSTIQLSPEDQGRGLNGVQKNFYFTTKASPKEDDYENAGFFGQRLRPYVAGNAEALDNLNRYRRQKWLFLAERVVFVGAVATYGSQVLGTDGDARYFSAPQRVTIGIAAVSLLSNVFITRHTNEHFVRAVEAHNGSLPSARRQGLMQRLAPSGIGMAVAPAGQPQLALRWQLR
jgi:hypothetical protein